MNKHVPSWDIDDEVAELTWEKGQLLAHGLVKPAPQHPRSAAGTLECIIDQAKLLHNQLNQLPSVAAIDALVPTHGRQREDMASGIGSCDIGDISKRKKRGMAGEEDDKVTAGGTMRRTISTKRSTVATVHNESEKKRRDRINEKMRTLQKLVPNSSKTDKASMLDEVIEYLKQLQAQVQMMRGMGGIPPMMMPMGMQQFQMIMMAQMAKMGMCMIDMSSIGSTGPTGISSVIPTSAFVPTISGPWEPSVDRIQQPTGVIMPDPFSAFLPCPYQQQVTMDTYQRMATLYPQMFHQTQPTNPK